MRGALALVAVAGCWTTTPSPTVPIPDKPRVPPGPVMTDLEPDLVRELAGDAPGLEAAFTAYRAKRYADAATGCHDVASSDPATKQRAQTCMAMSMYRLGLYAATLAYLDQIAESGPAHRDYDRSLVWLVATMRALPPPSGVYEKIATYPRGVLDDPALQRERGDLAYAMGHTAYDRGTLDQAVALFDKIEDNNAYYAKARSLAGAAYVRMFDGEHAAEQFKKLLAFARRYADEKLATNAVMQLARLQFSTQSYDRAIRAYSQVDGDEARLELAWSYFNANDRKRAAAALAPLLANGSDDPEVYSLQSVIEFADCEYDKAKATVETMKRRFEPIRADLRQIVEIDDNADLFDKVRPTVKKLGLDARGRQSIAWFEELEREDAALDRLDPKFVASPIGLDIEQELAVQSAVAKADAGRVVRNTIDRRLREIDGARRDGIKLEFEILNAKQNALSTGVPVCGKP